MSDIADSAPEVRRPTPHDPPDTVRGMPADAAKAIDALPPREFSVTELIWSDYVVAYRYKDESARARAIFCLPRMLTNSSMHANVLVRLLQGTPLWMTWFWRRLLITLHSCDFQPHCRIGPGLRMPHPFGIVVAHAVLGRNVVLQHHITVSPVRANWRSGKWPGYVQVGDGVTVFTGAVIAGRLAIGDDSVVGANSLVVDDLPAGHIVTRGRVRPASEAERSGL